MQTTTDVFPAPLPPQAGPNNANSRRFAHLALALGILCLTSGCQSIEETPEQRRRYEASLRQKPDNFSLLENNERMEQSSIPATNP
jgi:hypothetical protein